MGQKYECNCGSWVLYEIVKRIYPENLKKNVGPFGSYLLNSTANPAHFHSNWAGLGKTHDLQNLGSQNPKRLLYSHIGMAELFGR